MPPQYELTNHSTEWIPSASGVDIGAAAPSAADATALARYQTLFDHMAEGVVFQDADGRVIDANPAALRLLGLTMEQLQGTTAFDPRWQVIHLDGREVPGEERPGVVALRTGQAVKDAILGVFLPQEECYRWLRVNAIPRMSAAGSERPVGVFVTFDDITGWDYLEESARAHEARYQALLEQAVDAVFVADLEGRYIDVNPAACALLNYTREELLGKRIVDLVAPEDAPRLEAHREELLRGETHRGEWRLRRKDSLLVPVEVSARIMPDGRWQAIVRDVTERKRLEEELRHAEREASQAEARFRTLIEQAPDAIILLDPRGRIGLLNRQAEALFGYPRDALLGSPIERLLPTRFHALHRAHRAAYTAHPSVRSMGAQRELVGRRADGTEFPLEVSLGPIHVDGELQIAATCRDVTERRQMEQALRAQTEELTRTFEAMSEGVYVYDRTGQLLRINAAARILAGYDVHPEWERESASERLSRLQPRDAEGRPLPSEAWPVQRALRGETITNAAPVEYVITDPTGRDVILHVTAAPLHDAAGQVVGAVVVTHDVTEQRRLERELAARAREIESIFQTNADGVMLFDRQGRTIRMNAAQRRLLGYDAVGRVDYIPDPEERARLYAPHDVQGQPLSQEAWPINRVLRGETLTGPQAVELCLRTLDGREIQVSASGAPLYDEQGQIIGGVTATRDVTAQRRLEQQRTDILRLVAHDLANPLTAVKMYMQTQQRNLQRGQLPPVPDLEVLATMTHAVERMHRLLRDMQVVVGLEAKELSLDRRPCDLTALCRKEAQSLQIAETRDVQMNLPDEPVVVEADADRIGQVLGNLLSNADKYSPTEQPITFTLRVEQGAPDADAAATQHARVLVQDKGPGIPPNELAHIWERFHRIAGVQARPGTGGSLGLGLYISREIVERHGGSVGVESTPGKGSTFWFTLPLAPPH